MKAWFRWLVFATLVFAAFLIYEFFHVKPYLSYSLDFGSVFDAVVLFVVFIMIDYAYSKQSSEKRADTDLLLQLVSDSKASLHNLETTSRWCEQSKALTAAQRTELMIGLRELSNAIHSIEEGLRNCAITAHTVGLEKLKDARSHLNDCLSDTPFPGPYDPGSRARIRLALGALRDELTRVAFAINHR